MMGSLREWLTGLIAAAMLVAVADGLIPDGAVRKIAGFTGGLVLLVVLVQPVLHLETDRLRQSFETYAAQIDALEEEFTTQNQSELKGRIEETTASYICDKAASLGLDCQVSVTAEEGENGVPIPSSAEITGPYQEELAAYMESELGIPRDRQIWKGP